MSSRIKRISLWARRKSHLPVILVGGVIVMLLFINEDTSLSKNIEFQQRISEIKKEIRLCNDSAEYYKDKRESLLDGSAELEYVAREQYHMQRPTEDVYLIVDK